VDTGARQDARILAIDVGSSSVRAGFYDGSGEELENTVVKLDYEFEYTPDGGASKDADELLDLVASAVDGALSSVENEAVTGVAMSTFWHSVLGVDRGGGGTNPDLNPGPLGPRPRS
jgi:gluconokinase